MTESNFPARPISSEERQRAVDRLCAHFAQDHMQAPELERRLDLAYAARTRSELVSVDGDLPSLENESRDAPPRRELAPAARIDDTRPISERDFMIAVMGGTERKGNWIPPRTLTALSVMGGTSLDFRDATFRAREVSVRIFTIMGGAEVIVPPGVRVEWNGIALMGGVSGDASLLPAEENAPLIRISGLVAMGGIEITQRYPGESAREARKRLKAAARARRRLRSGEAPPGV